MIEYALYLLLSVGSEAGGYADYEPLNRYKDVETCQRAAEYLTTIAQKKEIGIFRIDGWGRVNDSLRRRNAYACIPVFPPSDKVIEREELEKQIKKWEKINND